MGILKRAGDLVYTFRFLRLLTTNFEDTDAYKMGIIDGNGKRIRKPETPEEKNVYTPFIRLVFNVKKLIPGGKIGSYASALYLIKEHLGISEAKLMEALKEEGIDPLEFMLEESKWFVLEDSRLSPGDYRVQVDKVLNETFDDIVNRKDYITIDDNCYPVGTIFGHNVYEATHKRSRQKVYVTVQELML